MRLGRYWLLAALMLPAAAAAQTADPFAAVDRGIAATKQAMMARPEQALASAVAAVALARALPPSARGREALGTAEWLHGEALIGVNGLSEAEPIVARTLAMVRRTAPRSKLHGDLLRSHGAIVSAQGRVLEALRDYQRAHEVFRAAGVARSQAIALQDIGAIYWDAGDYARTLDYYQQSADAFSGDATLTLTMFSNRAQVFYKQKRYTEAATAFRAALAVAKRLDSPLLQTRILTYLARSEIEAGRRESARRAIGQALTLSRRGEGAGWRPFVDGVAARIAFARGDLPQAQSLIAHAFAGADLSRTEMEYRDHHQIASRIFEAVGDDRQALSHLRAFQRLDSEAQALTASAASQLTAAQFDSANQKMRISDLTEGQLRRDVLLERQRGRLTSLALAALAVIAALLAIGFVSLRRSRNATRAANAVLSNVNDQLEGALKAKTEFLATTSHEIRTPLNGILGMTQVLLADRRVEGDVRDRLEVVQGAGETMKALVDDILDVAKIESGRLTVSEAATDLRQILIDVGRLWTGRAEAKGIMLSVDVAAAPTRLMTDGARVRQIVFNLMANALKFTSHGEVALAARVEPAAAGDRVVVTITDTGIGIPADQHEAIFEAFAQVDGGTTRQFGGTGLGLAICRNLARALGGDVTLASVVGEGSCFTLRLPLRRADAPAAAAPADRLAGASMVIVERDRVAASLLRMMLAAEGAGTVAVTDAAAAIEALVAGGVTHLVCVVGSAAGDDGDCSTALRRMIEAAGAADVPVSLLVDPDAPASVASLMMLGAAQIVIRPIDQDQLVAALATLRGDAPDPFVAPRLLDRAA